MRRSGFVRRKIGQRSSVTLALQRHDMPVDGDERGEQEQCEEAYERSILPPCVRLINDQDIDTRTDAP